MQLTDEQKRQIATRLAGGAGIADIQRLVNDEFKIHMTYMEVRFLLDDLDLDLAAKPTEPAAPTPPAEPIDAEADLVDEGDDYSDEYGGEPGSVHVEVDRIVRPGAAISGSVVFSDGVQANWFLDTYGRLALEASREGYKPSPEDIRAFQLQLQSKMR